MSNYLASKTLYGDTVGFLSKKPVSVLSAVWVPNSAGDILVLGYCEPGKAGQVVAPKGVVSAITSNAIITGVGTDYPSTFAAGDVLDIRQGNTKANLGLHLITTAGDNTHLHVEAELTDVAEDNIEVTSYAGRVFLKMGNAAKDIVQFHFDRDTIVPNLFIATMPSSGLVLVQIA